MALCKSIAFSLKIIFATPLSKSQLFICTFLLAFLQLWTTAERETERGNYGFYCTTLY